MLMLSRLGEVGKYLSRGDEKCLRNFVARDADVELVGVFVFATADQQQLVEQFVSSVLLTQLDSTDGGLHLHVRVGSKPDPSSYTFSRYPKSPAEDHCRAS